MRQTCTPTPKPPLLVARPGLRVWHKLDRRFAQPRAHCYLRVSPVRAHESPRAAALTHLWLRAVEDALNEDAYLADVAGLHYRCGTSWEQGSGFGPAAGLGSAAVCTAGCLKGRCRS